MATRLERWLKRRGYVRAGLLTEGWVEVFPGVTVCEVEGLPRGWSDDGGRVALGFVVMLAGQTQRAGAFFGAFEPAAAWARAGRQAESFSSVEIREAAAVVLWDEDREEDQNAFLLGGHRNWNDDACRSWAEQLDARTSHWQPK